MGEIGWAERFKEGKCESGRLSHRQALATGETNQKPLGLICGQLDFPIRSVLADFWLVVTRGSNLEARR